MSRGPVFTQQELLLIAQQTLAGLTPMDISKQYFPNRTPRGIHQVIQRMGIKRTTPPRPVELPKWGHIRKKPCEARWPDGTRFEDCPQAIRDMGSRGPRITDRRFI